MSDLLLEEAYRFLDWAREHGARLDGTDNSVWFVQGVVESMSVDAEEESSLRAVKCLAYSVYLAELLAATCSGVRCVVDGVGMHLREVFAVRDGAPIQLTLSWIQGGLVDPAANNIVFKFAGALRDFGEPQRAQALLEQLL
ncbi:hypothetical protein [Nocardia iowensis]|uniref:Uncharacterized protein n=1 Tax=Nocardia iowensis TaxID=204891 RepID=A0ABX8S0T7_NOCIO|nr:hypothetical protein [Nocardia iowensis]QXN94697.1 hypothetical protein KV110_17560 [Nocardia iowensis]